MVCFCAILTIQNAFIFKNIRQIESNASKYAVFVREPSLNYFHGYPSMKRKDFISGKEKGQPVDLLSSFQEKVFLLWGIAKTIYNVLGGFYVNYSITSPV